MSFKLDLHFHTESHGRTLVTHEELQKSLNKNGLDGVAVTNFFDISHALWLKKKLPDSIIIVGQEIWTKEGHILGLGLKETIKDTLSAADTIALIHEQGAIAVAPHPFIFLGVGKRAKSLLVDAIEVYSGLMGATLIFNYMARKMAEDMNVPQIASTDTTDPYFLGRSYTEVFVDIPEMVIEGIREGRVSLRKRPLPLPVAFIIKGILNVPNMEPCSLHAVPCFICGKTMRTGLFRKKYICHDCGKQNVSRISCCNGHYLCIECVLRRGADAAKDNKMHMASEK
jgi:hypothetical protein